jgi:uncharacterized membrane protein
MDDNIEQSVDKGIAISTGAGTSKESKRKGRDDKRATKERVERLDTTDNNDKIFERLIFFSDAVVAVALTLLVLPLTDYAVEESHEGISRSMSKLFSENFYVVFSFLLSFFVIIKLWNSHRHILGRAKKGDGKLFLANSLWIFTVAIIPLATQLLSGKVPRENTIFYALILLVNTSVLRFMSNYIQRNLDTLGDYNNDFIKKYLIIRNIISKKSNAKSYIEKAHKRNGVIDIRTPDDLFDDNPEALEAWNDIKPVFNDYATMLSLTLIILITFAFPLNSQYTLLILVATTPVEKLVKTVRLSKHSKKMEKRLSRKGHANV